MGCLDQSVLHQHLWTLGLIPEPNLNDIWHATFQYHWPYRKLLLGAQSANFTDFLLSKYQLWAKDTLRELQPRADIYQAKSQKAKRGWGQEKVKKIFSFLVLMARLTLLCYRIQKNIDLVSHDSRIFWKSHFQMICLFVFTRNDIFHAFKQVRNSRGNVKIFW